MYERRYVHLHPRYTMRTLYSNIHGVSRKSVSTFRRYLETKKRFCREYVAYGGDRKDACIKRSLRGIKHSTQLSFYNSSLASLFKLNICSALFTQALRNSTSSYGVANFGNHGSVKSKLTWKSTPGAETTSLPKRHLSVTCGDA